MNFVRNFHLSDLVEARKEMNKVVQEMKKKQQIPQERKLLQIEGDSNQGQKNLQQKRKFFIHQDRYLKPVSTGAFERKLEQERRNNRSQKKMNSRILAERELEQRNPGKKKGKKIKKKQNKKLQKKVNKKQAKKKANKKLSKKASKKVAKKASKKTQKVVKQNQTKKEQKQSRKLQDRKLSKRKHKKHHKRVAKKHKKLHKKKHHLLRFRVLSSKKQNKNIRRAEKIEIDERNLREVPSLNEYYNDQLNLYGRIQFNI